MANKRTKRDVINMMLDEDVVKANEVYVNYLNHELELLDKKSAQPRKSKVNAENEGYRAIILDILGSADAPMSLSEIKAQNDAFAKFSTQKMSSIIKPLCDAHTVVKTMEKREVKFFLA